MAHEYWLKMIGAADREVGDRWIEARPRLLREVRFPKQPSGISRGDVLVYYAAGDQKLFAIAKAKHDGSECEMGGPKDEARWPYVMEVEMLLAIPRLALAPEFSVMGVSPDSVKQQSHIRIDQENYLLAQQAMAKRTAEF
jgi:hypothetical protein